MSVGDSANILSDSYFAVGKESTFGTGVTCTSALDFISLSLKTVQESKTLEQVERKRTMSKSIRMGRVIEGDCEFYFVPQITASSYIIANAFGGTITSATATGESTGASNMAYTHTFNIGNMDQNTVSLSGNLRRGPTTTGKVFEYVGLRVNTLAVTAEIDEALKMSASFVGKDVSQTSNDVETALTISSAVPLSFEDGRFSVENSFASLTSTSFWHVQSVNFEINNNLKTDNESRRIGSDVLDVMPVGIANFVLNVTMRFDTITAYTAMIDNSTLAAEFEFTGMTESGSAIAPGIKFRFPKLKVNDAGLPEVGGPDGILTSEVAFQVLRDDSSATGYSCIAELTNYAASI
jgi:hypothetical protein